ncbi:MAG TPA: type 4a pilus biogenesis protein PilO, partial [Mycobacteriales bacterium]
PGNPTAFTASPVAQAAAASKAGGTSSTTTTSSASAGAVSGLAQIPVSLSVTGSYFDIEQFLDQLEGLQRSMLVNTFTIGYQGDKAASSGSTQTVGNGELTVSIQAQVFMSTAALGSATTAATGSTTTSAASGGATAATAAK